LSAGAGTVSRVRPQVTAADRAYSTTKELILCGDLPPGRLFSEGEIAERLSISRTPVREAFLRLQAEDLLQLIPKRGAVVTPVPASEIEDVLDTREALECAAVRRLVQRGDGQVEPHGEFEAALQPLRDIIATQRRHARAGELSAFAIADEQFHRAIVTASGNRLAERFYATLADRQRRMVIGAIGRRTERLTALADDHQNLLDLIAGRDAAGFGRALRLHLAATHRPVTGR
jgi:DNA-binding GntR family transcriptional regulator